MKQMVYLHDPAPEVLLLNFGASTIDLRARWWIEPPRRTDALQSRDAFLRGVKRRFAEHGIDLPFPTQVLLFHDQTEATDGDRSRQREGWPARPQHNPEPMSLSRSIRDLRPKD